MNYPAYERRYVANYEAIKSIIAFFGAEGEHWLQSAPRNRDGSKICLTEALRVFCPDHRARDDLSVWLHKFAFPILPLRGATISADLIYFNDRVGSFDILRAVLFDTLAKAKTNMMAGKMLHERWKLIEGLKADRKSSRARRITRNTYILCPREPEPAVDLPIAA
jgi:hypothetical protein